MTIEFSKVASDYAQYRPTYPASTYLELSRFGFSPKDQKILELGCGPGNFAVGAPRKKLEYIAADKSIDMIQQARVFLADQIETTCLKQFAAECIPYPDSYFDWVICAQSWHLFDQPAASQEIRRVLSERGQLALVHISRISHSSDDVVTATNAIISNNNRKWNHGGVEGFFVEHVKELLQLGFFDVRTFSFDTTINYTLESWIGRIVASKGVGASLNTASVKNVRDQMSTKLACFFNGGRLGIQHRVFGIVCAAKDDVQRD